MWFRWNQFTQQFRQNAVSSGRTPVMPRNWNNCLINVDSLDVKLSGHCSDDLIWHRFIICAQIKRFNDAFCLKNNLSLLTLLCPYENTLIIFADMRMNFLFNAQVIWGGNVLSSVYKQITLFNCALYLKHQLGLKKVDFINSKSSLYMPLAMLLCPSHLWLERANNFDWPRM